MLKKTAAGVKGIKLGKGESTSSAFLLTNGEGASVEWNGKTVTLHRLKVAKRGGQGNKVR